MKVRERNRQTTAATAGNNHHRRRGFGDRRKRQMARLLRKKARSGLCEASDLGAGRDYGCLDGEAPGEAGEQVSEIPQLVVVAEEFFGIAIVYPGKVPQGVSLTIEQVLALHSDGT